MIIIFNQNNSKDCTFDIITNMSVCPTLLVLLGADGSVSHAVSSTGNWLFDSNLVNAQPLTQELLNWCVSSPETTQKCMGAYWCMRLFPKLPILSYFQQGTR